MAKYLKDRYQKNWFKERKVNYCLKALIDIGLVKINNFSNSNKKLNYVYILTPKALDKNSYNKTIYYQKETRIR